jgi:hypothetical protein
MVDRVFGFITLGADWMRKNVCRSGQGYGPGFTWIRIILGRWNRVSIKVKIQEL